MQTFSSSCSPVFHHVNYEPQSVTIVYNENSFDSIMAACILSESYKDCPVFVFSSNNSGTCNYREIPEAFTHMVLVGTAVDFNTCAEIMKVRHLGVSKLTIVSNNDRNSSSIWHLLENAKIKVTACSYFVSHDVTKTLSELAFDMFNHRIEKVHGHNHNRAFAIVSQEVMAAARKITFAKDPIEPNSEEDHLAQYLTFARNQADLCDRLRCIGMEMEYSEVVENELLTFSQMKTAYSKELSEMLEIGRLLSSLKDGLPKKLVAKPKALTLKKKKAVSP